MNSEDILLKPFDINIHADNFVDYLEVVIKPNGLIEYAVPSHSKKLEEIAGIKYGKDKILEMLKDPNAWHDYMKWLCDITGCISVWNEFCIRPDKISQEQLCSLNKLKNKNYTRVPNLKLYRGE